MFSVLALLNFRQQCLCLFVAIIFLFFAFLLTSLSSLSVTLSAHSFFFSFFLSRFLSCFSFRSSNNCYYLLLPHIFYGYFAARDVRLLLLIICRFYSPFLKIVLDSFSTISIPLTLFFGLVHFCFCSYLLFHSMWIILAVSCWRFQTIEISQMALELLLLTENTKSYTIQLCCLCRRDIVDFVVVVVIISIKLLYCVAFHFVGWLVGRTVGICDTQHKIRILIRYCWILALQALTFLLRHNVQDVYPD